MSSDAFRRIIELYESWQRSTQAAEHRALLPTHTRNRGDGRGDQRGDGKNDGYPHGCS
jgi:hypothetical protein